MATEIQINQDEWAWAELLDFIEEGKVVPVIGPDLVRVQLPEGEVRLDQAIAARLARRWGLEQGEVVSKPYSLRTVAAEYLARGGIPRDVSDAVKDTFDKLGDFQLPDVLVKLAEIEPLDLFVTLTFDDLMQRALDHVRFGGKPNSTAYRHKLKESFPVLQAKKGQPAVFYLFGRISRLLEYAISEEDILEYAHALISRSTDQPQPCLFDELKQRNLLIIGTDLSGWLQRFFLRVARRQRLSLARSTDLTDFFVDEGVRNDVSLVAFLRAFTNRHLVFPGNSVDFIGELHNRWQQRAATQRLPIEELQLRRAVPSAARKIFISYAQEDQEVAQLLANTLKVGGLDVWFDKNEFGGGEKWESVIKKEIDASALFIPIISRQTAVVDTRFFRHEWKWGIETSELRRQDLEFLFPVVIDDTSHKADWIPKEFQAIHWARFDGSGAPEELIDSLRNAYKNYERWRQG